MSDDATTTTTTDALVQLSFAVQRVLAAAGAEKDLSLIQVRMLGVLRDRQIGMLELGQHLGLDKSSVTGLVTRAERRGLVRRSPSPDDGRAVLVTTTPLGRDVADAGAARIAAGIVHLTEHLGDERRTLLTELAAEVVRPAAPR